MINPFSVHAAMAMAPRVISHDVLNATPPHNYNGVPFPSSFLYTVRTLSLSVTVPSPSLLLPLSLLLFITPSRSW